VVTVLLLGLVVTVLLLEDGEDELVVDVLLGRVVTLLLLVEFSDVLPLDKVLVPDVLPDELVPDEV